MDCTTEECFCNGVRVKGSTSATPESSLPSRFAAPGDMVVFGHEKSTTRKFRCLESADLRLLSG
eukprot:6835618-Pyramimonas_sp.AAC.1